MKFIITLFISILLSFTAHSQHMPAFKEVIGEFYSKYSSENVEAILRFEKRKDGWYVAQEDYANPGKHFNSTLFWTSKGNSFLDIHYETAIKDTAAISKQIAEYFRQIDGDYEERQFKLHKYYGYPGWTWDVINDSIVQTKMTDSNWESKARAYSNYATGFIAEQYGDVFENNDPDRVPLKPDSKINKSRIDKFIYYESKAIEAYEKILSLNPFYQTTVGNIQIKCANEYLFTYCELILAEDSISARKFLVKASYPDSVIAQYKTFLEVLPFNSILIAGGDNDTYTLWFLQEAMNYRKDVVVLNVSLLGFRRYLFVTNKKYKGKLFSTPDSIFLKNNFDYFLYSNKTAEIKKISIANFILNLNKNINPYDHSQTLYKDEPLKTYYSKELFFTAFKKMSNSKTGSGISRILTLKDYMYMNDFILLDIINSNIPGKKVFFTFPYDFISEILEYRKPVFEVSLFVN